MRTRLIAVIGSGKELDKEVAVLAEEMGAALVRAGYGIVSGGLGGVMEAVSRGAVRARGKELTPPIIGILPSYDVTSGNPYLDLVVPSGLSHARNALVAAAGEAVICIGGATGALSEVGLARKIGRPVLAFPGTGGTASLVGKALHSVIEVETVDEAMEALGQQVPSVH
jgi:uncharacterized protein (TIGR00725 family)